MIKHQSVTKGALAGVIVTETPQFVTNVASGMGIVTEMLILVTNAASGGFIVTGMGYFVTNAVVEWLVVTKILQFVTNLTHVVEITFRKCLFSRFCRQISMFCFSQSIFFLKWGICWNCNSVLSLWSSNFNL